MSLELKGPASLMLLPWSWTQNTRGSGEGRREDATTLYGEKPSLQQKTAKLPPLQLFIGNSGGGRGGVWCYHIRSRLLNSAVWLNPKLIQVNLCYCDSRRMDKYTLNPLHFYVISRFGIKHEVSRLENSDLKVFSLSSVNELSKGFPGLSRKW